MNDKLCQEAMDLHHLLYEALLAEEGKRDAYGHKTGDPKRTARLERLVHKAADRWRRLKGYSPVYALDGIRRLR